MINYYQSEIPIMIFQLVKAASTSPKSHFACQLTLYFEQVDNSLEVVEKTFRTVRKPEYPAAV